MNAQYASLHNALHCLPTSGPAGFEGLILALISRLTGLRLFLARGGFQAGKDAGTAGYGQTYVAIECKQYEVGSSPRERDILGGFDQAIDASDGNLDLWLLVSTGSIGSTEAEALRRKAVRAAVSVEIIDWQEAGLPQLAVFCAGLAEETLSELKKRNPQIDLLKVAADLEAIRLDPKFSQHVAEMKDRLAAADLGLDHARAAGNDWITARLANKAEAMAAFCQALCVADADFQTYVERRTVQAKLDAWYGGWSSRPSLAAVLGLEGMGKSWVTMGWWSRLNTKPLTLLITSKHAVQSDASTLIASALLRQTGVRDLEFWRSRIERWLRRSPSTSPEILLVLDGLNEQPAGPWDEIFASLAAKRWQGRVAIAATCRPQFWSERVAPFLPDTQAASPDTLPVTVLEIGPFDDEELAQAWAGLRPKLSEMPGPLRDFIRTPRVLRLARSHGGRLIETGDLTIERLLIEDWKDRRQLKTGLAHSGVEFNNLVIDLARDLHNGLPNFRLHELQKYSSLALRSPGRNLEKDFNEIIAGQLFETIDPVSDRHRVRPEFASLALGMLLAREARDAHLDSETAGVERVLARALDAIVDFDQTTVILCSACAVACLELAYPADARRMLFGAWLRSRDLDDTQWHNFAAYLPLQPETYFDLAEDFWCGAEIYPTIRRSVADAILRWRNLPSVERLTSERCRRWLGLWHSDWHPFLTKPNADRLARRRQAVRENQSRLTAAERHLAEDLLTEAPIPNAPWIARLALLLISHGPRAPHVDGLVAWALSRALMGLPDETEEVGWCLRLNDYDPAKTEAAILAGVEQLLKSGPSEVAIRAARLLLWACGTSAAEGRLASLPEPMREESWLQPRKADVDALDPAAPTPGSLDRAIERLGEINPRDVWCSMGQGESEIRLEEVEPILAHFAPGRLCEFYGRLLRAAHEREGVHLRQLAWHIPSLLLLVGLEEAYSLDRARRSIFPSLESDKHDACAIEAYLLLGLLPRAPIEGQLNFVLERPQPALGLPLFEDVVASVPASLADDYLNQHPPAEQAIGYWRRLFWLLSRSPFVLSDAARETLVRHFNHLDANVRAYAFSLADTCRDPQALRVHGASEWSARSVCDALEAFHGSLALIAGADPVHYAALRHRIAPDLLGYLAHKDGTPAAIDAFAADLDAIWNTMTQAPFESAETIAVALMRKLPVGTGPPEIERVKVDPIVNAALQTIRVFGGGPTVADLDRFFQQSDPNTIVRDRRAFQERLTQIVEQAQRAGHAFFGKRVRLDGLSAVIARRSDLVDKWLRFLDQCDRAPWDTAEFYRALCGALGRNQPDRAADVLDHLRRGPAGSVTYTPLNIDSLTWLAFAIPSSAKTDAIRDQLLDEAHADDQLFAIALAAQRSSAADWLARVIERDVAAPDLHHIGRALSLIGFLDDSALVTQLRGHLDGRSGFLEEVSKCARERLQRNERARTWLQEFLLRPDPVEAWAAFRLFLRCVDRRYYLWGDAIRKATDEVPELWHQHVTMNDEEIRRAAERNEGRLSETLFGLRVSAREISPWYRTPPPANIA